MNKLSAEGALARIPRTAAANREAEKRRLAAAARRSERQANADAGLEG